MVFKEDIAIRPDKNEIALAQACVEAAELTRRFYKPTLRTRGYMSGIQHFNYTRDILYIYNDGTRETYTVALSLKELRKHTSQEERDQIRWLAIEEGTFSDNSEVNACGVADFKNLVMLMVVHDESRNDESDDLYDVHATECGIYSTNAQTNQTLCIHTVLILELIEAGCRPEANPDKTRLVEKHIYLLAGIRQKFTRRYKRELLAYEVQKCADRPKATFVSTLVVSDERAPVILEQAVARDREIVTLDRVMEKHEAELRSAGKKLLERSSKMEAEDEGIFESAGPDWTENLIIQLGFSS